MYSIYNMYKGWAFACPLQKLSSVSQIFLLSGNPPWITFGRFPK